MQPFRFHSELKPLATEPLLVRIGMYLLFSVVVCLFVAGPVGMIVYMAFHPLEAGKPLVAWLVGVPVCLAILGIGLWVSHHAMVTLSEVREPRRVLMVLVALLFLVMIVAHLFGIETVAMAATFLGWIPLAFAAMVFTELGPKIHKLLDSQKRRRG